MSVMENKFELLSAYLDGESLSDEQLLELMSDEECMSKWEDYTRRRAAVRDELPNGINMDEFSSRMSEKLNAEPQYISIRPHDDKQVVGEAVNDELPEAQHSSGMTNDFWSSLGRIAVAAAVACVCVFGVQRMPFVHNSDFNDDSVFNSGMSIEPVSNTVVSGEQNLKLDIGTNEQPMNGVEANNVLVSADSRNSEQVEKYKTKKLEEMNTIEALLNDHDSARRNIVQDR